MVDYKPQVAKNIFDFLSLIKRQPPHNAVFDVHAAQRFFYGTRLAVSAIKNGDIGVQNMVVHFLFKNRRRHQLALLVVRIGFYQLYEVAVIVRCPHIFWQLCPVVLNHSIGGIHDHLGGAVVLFQLDNSQFGKVFFEIQNILDISPAKRIDTLGIVAYHANILVNIRELTGNEVLRNIGVLKLIYQHVAKAMLVLIQHVGVIAKQDIGVEQEIVKIHGSRFEASLCIDFIQPAYFGPHGAFIVGLQRRVIHVFSPRYQAVFGAGYAVEYGIGFIHLVVEPLLFYDGFDQ